MCWAESQTNTPLTSLLHPQNNEHTMQHRHQKMKEDTTMHSTVSRHRRARRSPRAPPAEGAPVRARTGTIL